MILVHSKKLPGHPIREKQTDEQTERETETEDYDHHIYIYIYIIQIYIYIYVVRGWCRSCSHHEPALKAWHVHAMTSDA